MLCERELAALVAAIVTSRRGVLITLRLGGVLPWGFVTGKIEPGESRADAAAREVKEETGLGSSTARSSASACTRSRSGW
jgi:8-oxo-dGTP diphosphatase